jgi:hypothetical protein
MQGANLIHPADVVIVEATFALLHHQSNSLFTKLEIVRPRLRRAQQPRILRILQPWIIWTLVVTMIALAVFEIMPLFISAGIISVAAVTMRVLTWN